VRCDPQASVSRNAALRLPVLIETDLDGIRFGVLEAYSS